MNSETYLLEHCLDADFIKSQFGVVVEENKIIFPVKDIDGKEIFKKTRNLDEGRKFDIPQGVTAGDYLFNADQIKTAEWVIYSEGEMDCMKLVQEGIPAVSSVIGGGGVPKNLEVLIGKQIFVCLDSDEAGNKFVPEVARSLGATSSPIRIIELPTIAKDICEYFHLGKTASDFEGLRRSSLTIDEWELKHAPEEFEIESGQGLLEREIPPLGWFIEQLIPDEGITILQGPPGVGKSFLALATADSVISGRPFMGKFEVNKLASVLLIDKENGDRRLRDRIVGLGMKCFSPVNGHGFYHVRFPHLLKISDETEDSGISKFASHIAKFVQVNKIGLIIFDSLVDVIEGNENDAGATQLFFDKVRYLFPEVPMLILAHESKQNLQFQSDRSLLELIRGSGNIGGQIAIGIRTTRIKGGANNEFKLESTKNRDGAPIQPFKYTMDCIADPLNAKGTIVKSLTYQGEAVIEVTKTLEVRQVVQDMIPHETDNVTIVTAEDVKLACKQRGIEEKTVKTTLSQMRKEGYVDFKPLPKGHPRNDTGKKNRYFRPMNAKTFYNQNKANAQNN